MKYLKLITTPKLPENTYFLFCNLGEDSKITVDLLISILSSIRPFALLYHSERVLYQNHVPVAVSAFQISSPYPAFALHDLKQHLPEDIQKLNDVAWRPYIVHCNDREIVKQIEGPYHVSGIESDDGEFTISFSSKVPRVELSEKLQLTVGDLDTVEIVKKKHKKTKN